jgi:hypothetical protein
MLKFTDLSSCWIQSYKISAVFFIYIKGERIRVRGIEAQILVRRRGSHIF